MYPKCERNCKDCSEKLNRFIDNVLASNQSGIKVMISDPWQSGQFTSVHAKHRGYAYVVGGDGNLYSVEFFDACRNFQNGNLERTP